MDILGRAIALAVLATVAGTAVAEAPVVQKPAPNRFYGTARPPGMPAPPGAPPAMIAPPPSMAPPPVIRPGPVGGAYLPPGGSVYVPPPVVRPPLYYRPRPHVGVDVVIGAPLYRPYWGSGWYDPFWRPYPPVIVSPPVVVTPPPPMVYIERPADPAQPAAGFWYWCAEPQGWYPEVPECPQGWQAVPPRAAAQ